MACEPVNILKSFIFVEETSFLIRNNGEQVSAGELEGKTLGIYFLSNYKQSIKKFTEKLKGIYKELKDQGESFEIVSVISHEKSKESFMETAESLPWLAVPFEDERGDKLAYYFRIESFPILAIVGKDGGIVSSDVSDLIEEHGIHAYPFSPVKLTEFEEIEKARLEAQTLGSLLVDEERDFLIRKDGIMVPVGDLVGKTILFYFSSNVCPPCQRFKPTLIKAYHDIKARDTEFEIIFISGDKDQSAFDESHSTMPWLAMPFGDKRTKSLCRELKLKRMPTVAAVGPNGRTITNKAKDFLIAFGSDAYPFTKEHLNEILEGLPRRLNHELHQEHELELVPQYDYFCDACGEAGFAWSFHCTVCNFDLDLKCGMGDARGDGNHMTSNGSDNGGTSDGLICNGQVCYRI